MASAGRGLCSGCAVVFWSIVILAVTGTAAKEYCLTEEFKASCQEGQILVIESALYGRMLHGRCIRDKLGHMGCKADVRPRMDQLCSGKNQCQIVTVVLAFEDITPCPEGLFLYLDVNYKCINAFSPSSSQCMSSSGVYAPPPPGVLTNSVPTQSQCSSQYSTWIIEVSATQRVNITLTDFGTLANEGSSTCKKYVIIREESRQSETEVCGGSQRSHHVYTSHGSKVEVSLAAPDQIEGQLFLLHYQAIGCEEPTYPQDMWMKVGPDGVTLGCYTSKVTWRLTCKGSSWQGITGNCSSMKDEVVHQLGNGTWTFFSPVYEGGLTFLVAAAAVVITIAILVVALLYTNRGPAPAIALGSLDEPYEAKDITFFRDDPRATCQNDTAASTMHHTHTNGLPRESCVSVPVSNSDSDTYASENATLPLRAHDMEGFDSTLQPPLPSKNRQTPKPPTPDIPPPELPPKCPPKVGSGYRKNDLGPYTKLNADNAFPNRENQLTYKSLQRDNTNLTRPLPPVPINPL